MSDFFLVRDDGFHADDGAEAPVLAPDTDPASLGDYLDQPLLAVDFPSFPTVGALRWPGCCAKRVSRVACVPWAA